MITVAYIAAIIALVAISTASMYFHNRSESRWFIECQQMQSKIDLLSEKLLQRDGVPVDFTRPTRQQFTERVKQVSFAQGWRSDKPATPDAGRK